MTNRRGNDRHNPLTRALGGFSIALGIAEVAVPKQLARFIGLEGNAAQQWLLRGYGARELTAGAGILATARRSGWMWSRVAGDAIDIASLTAALVDKPNLRKGLATASVVGVSALDVLTAVQTSRTAGRDFPVKRTITVNKPVEEVYDYWHDFAKLPTFMRHLESVTVEGTRSTWTATGPGGRTVTWHAETTFDRRPERLAWRSVDGLPNEGVVVFRPAPGGRGTEVDVELSFDPPGGPFGNAVARLFGEHPDQQVADDLRRFKQILETGEIVRSDSNPDGLSSTQQVKQRPARPMGDPR